jgi:hypothetical protein
MDVRPDEGAVKRRKMRKGTHSCTECRRRKVKCVFSTPDSTTCVVCLRRGTHCFSQADSPSPATAGNVDVDGKASVRFPVIPHALPTATSSSVDSSTHLPSTTNVSSAIVSPRIAAATALQHGLLAYQPSIAKNQHHTCVSREDVSAVLATNVGASRHMAVGATDGGTSPMMMPGRYASAQSAGFELMSRPPEFTTTPTEHTSAAHTRERIESRNAQDAIPQAAALSNPPMMPNDVAPPFPAACFDDAVMDTLLY